MRLSQNSWLKSIDQRLESPFITNPYRFAGGAWDWEDPFTADAWTPQDTGAIDVNTVAEVFDANFLRNSSNDANSADPTGAVLDDTAWVFRMIDFQFSSYDNSSGSGNLGAWFSLANLNSATNFDTATSHSGISFFLTNGTGFGAGEGSDYLMTQRRIM